MLEGAKVMHKHGLSFLPYFLYSREYIVSVNSNFPVPKGHDANFAWSQYETAVKFVRE